MSENYLLFALLLQRQKTSECEFYEEVDRRAGYWNTYYSVQHPNNTEKSVKWYIALNKRGRPRSAMTTKHRSSRFMTQSTHAQAGSLAPPLDIVPPSQQRNEQKRGGKKRYSRPDSVKSEPIRLRQGEDKQKRDRLSTILDSIETMLSKASPDTSNSIDFRESMLIDLGDANPFELFDDNPRPIRHKSSKSKRRKSSRYRRIER